MSYLCICKAITKNQVLEKQQALGDEQALCYFLKVGMTRECGQCCQEAQELLHVDPNQTPSLLMLPDSDA